MFLPIFKVFSNLKTWSTSHLAMSTDDRFLPQDKQILPIIRQVRPMPYVFATLRDSNTILRTNIVQTLYTVV